MKTEVRDIEETWGRDTPYDVEILFVHYETEDGKTRFANVERLARDDLRELRTQIDKYLGDA